MLEFRSPVVVQLSPGELLRCRQAGDLTISVLAGRIWVTRANDPDDHFLETGATMRLVAGAQALVGAEGNVRLLLTPDAARRPHNGAPRFLARRPWTFLPTS